MILDGLETYITDWKTFKITITQESDLSMDGGYTFETVTNEYELNRSDAEYLILELERYVDSLK